MKTREIAAEHRKVEWKQIIQERAVSGESISQFCESRGIRRNQYFYWQHKLRESANKELIEPFGLDATKSKRTQVPSGWAVAELRTPGKSMLVVEISGCRIEVTESTDTELLVKTCHALRSLC